MERPPLIRPREDRALAGVCAGLAAHLRLPVAPVRAGLAVLTLFGGAGGLLYLWLWATVPPEGETEGVVPLKSALTRPAGGSAPAAAPAPPASAAGVPRAAEEIRTAGEGARTAGGTVAAAAAAGPTGSSAGSGTGTAEAGRAPLRLSGRWPIAEMLLGGCLLIAGAGLVLDRLGVHLNLTLVLPGLAVLVGLGLTWWQIADRDRPERNQVPRVLGALALVAVGVLMFFVTAREPSVWTVVAAAIAVLAGVALAIAPWLLRLNRELIAERAARAREAERSDIAAHLHDSVLQTLALIQQRSEPGSEVSRLARGQERELREWLFRGADGATAMRRAAVDVELRAHAAALEAEHPVRFEFVTVGTGDELEAPETIVAAAREAMLNAARHAGGEVTVYLEATQQRIAIDITDRGPGLDPGALPEGRMGVRESILGRMERAGGTARIVPGPGGGTSVRLGIPRDAEGVGTPESVGGAVGAPGSAAPGAEAPGTAVPGAAVPGAAVPGTAVPGVAVPGAAVPGSGEAHQERST
ncbi:PspC domain-containing protein [Leucobacter allii]|uniref:ATP-binding protein n=1 Tax=Leucobacter allii TaxID=2932247 RepID=UPI001FD1FFCE|nr:ATP-binding protein [Leucobacter allii]UOR00920.1 PspC domain-containing protein [Leucobacter allii]